MDSRQLDVISIEGYGTDAGGLEESEKILPPSPSTHPHTHFEQFGGKNEWPLKSSPYGGGVEGP